MPNMVDRLKAVADCVGEQNGPLIRAAAGEIWLLREIVAGVRLMANTGAFKEYEGEPWLLRVRNIDLNS